MSRLKMLFVVLVFVSSLVKANIGHCQQVATIRQWSVVSFQIGRDSFITGIVVDTPRGDQQEYMMLMAGETTKEPLGMDSAKHMRLFGSKIPSGRCAKCYDDGLLIFGVLRELFSTAAKIIDTIELDVTEISQSGYDPVVDMEDLKRSFRFETDQRKPGKPSSTGKGLIPDVVYTYISVQKFVKK